MKRNPCNKLFQEYPDLLTLTELAKMLDISTKFASKLIKEGKIEAVKIGRAYRIAKRNVIKFVLDGQDKKGGDLIKNSNPKRWTCRLYYGMLCTTKEEKEGV